MKTIELYKGIYSSQLGFGCAPILGSVDAATAKRAIEVALDCGINHFDLARSYGYGEAESFVGNVLKSRRNQVILVSKFGIKANWKASFLKPLKPIVRLLKASRSKKKISEEFPILEANTKPKIPIADFFHNRLLLNGKSMRISLETSLKSIKTDYLDIFLIHEPVDTLLYFDELAETAERLKDEGKIKAWGLAYVKSQEHFHEHYLDKFDLLQFNNSPGNNEYAKSVKTRGGKSNVFFSPLRGGTTHLTTEQKLSTLFGDFPKSVVLCSMFNEKHIKANALLSK